MPRPRTVDPLQVVADIRSGERQSAVARKYSISRPRVSQILDEHAPELRKRPKAVVELSADAKAAWTQERAMLVAHINDHETHKEAAQALKLTPSGLYARMRRYEIAYN